MKFKITHSLTGMHVRREDHLPAHFIVGEALEFTLWMRQIAHQGQQIRQLCCDAVVDRQPPQRVEDTLLALADNRLLLDDPIQEGLPQTLLGYGEVVDIDGWIKPNFIVDFYLLPKSVKPWLREIQSDLSGKLRTFVKQLRWLQNTEGGHSPFSSIGSFWSVDGLEWRRLPEQIQGVLHDRRAIDSSETGVKDVVALARRGFQEPIYHDLMREAAEVVNRTPRSALLISFAALEAGLKIHLGRLLPMASPLIDRMPSPPIIKILQEILPEIMERAGRSSPHIPLKKDASQYLMKWVAQRNQVTHGTKHTVKGDDVSEFIEFAHAILYMLDTLDGHEWAATHVKNKHLA